MDSNKKVVKDKTILSDYEIVGNLLMISAMSKSLAKTIVLRGNNDGKNYKGGGNYGRRKRTQYSRTKF